MGELIALELEGGVEEHNSFPSLGDPWLEARELEDFEVKDLFTPRESCTLPNLSAISTFKAALGSAIKPVAGQKLAHRGCYGHASVVAMVHEPYVSTLGRTDLWYAQEAIWESQVRSLQLSSRPVAGASWSA